MTHSDALGFLAKVLGQTADQIFARTLPTFRIDEFRRKKRITYQDDLADAARLIVSGSAELYKWRSDGAQFLLHTAKHGDWIGLAESLSGGPYLTDAIPAPCCVTVTFGISATRDLVKRYPEALSRILAQGYYQLHGHLKFVSARERIVRLLVGHVDKNFSVMITQEDIAHRLSLSRETVNRVLRDMEVSGMVETGRGKITLLAPLVRGSEYEST